MIFQSFLIFSFFLVLPQVPSNPGITRGNPSLPSVNNNGVILQKYDKFYELSDALPSNFSWQCSCSWTTKPQQLIESRKFNAIAMYLPPDFPCLWIATLKLLFWMKRYFLSYLLTFLQCKKYGSTINKTEKNFKPHRLHNKRLCTLILQWRICTLILQWRIVHSNTTKRKKLTYEAAEPKKWSLKY